MTAAAVPAPDDSRAARLALALLLVAGFLVRLGVFYAQPHLIYFDEVFQAIEPAHKLVFGTGITTWEFEAGIRSWLLPGVMAGLLWLGSHLGTNPTLINLPITLAMTALSLAPVYCGFQWGRRLFGLAGGLMVGTVNACWVDLVNFAPHTLNEVVAGDTLILALYFASAIGPKAGSRPVLAGLLAGLTVVLRIHLAPALLVACLFGSGFRFDRWLWRYVAAAAVPVVCAGALDWLTWGLPFQSIWWNFWVNVVGGVSLDFGDQPAAFFLDLLPYLWGAFSLVLIGAALVGARQLPALLAVAATIFLTHTLFGHKEFRFVYPALPLLTTLAGCATAAGVRHLQALRAETLSPNIVTILAMSFWIFASFIVAISPPYRQIWSSDGAEVAAFQALSRWDGLCGVGVAGPPEGLNTAGNSYLPPGIPLYGAADLHVPADASAFNAITAFAGQGDYGALGFTRQACFDGDLDEAAKPRISLCVWTRPGTCAGSGVAYRSPIPRYFQKSSGAIDWDHLHQFRR